VDRTTISIPVTPTLDSASERPIEINRITIQKGLDRQVVLYWYQAHGRVIGSEYLGKIYTVLDAVRMNRTDAALVRIISPVPSLDVQGHDAAEKAAINFVQSVFPLLSQYLPD
jgi:EpsI family protein